MPSHNPETYKMVVGKDTFSVFLKNLEIALDAGIKVNVNMVAHQLNKDGVYGEAMFLKRNYGIKKFAVTPMLRPACRRVDGYDLTLEDNIKIFDDLIRLREEEGLTTAILEVTPKCGIPEEYRDDPLFSRGCSAGKITSAISYNGEVRVCAHAPFSEGNLLTEDFDDIWARMKPWRVHGYIPEDCGKCVELQECKGGCRFAAYEEGQPLDTKDYRCGEPIREKEVREIPELDPNHLYKTNTFMYREERAGEFTLYTQEKIIFANTEMKNFLQGVYEDGGIRINDLPEGAKNKASNLCKILHNRGFILK